MSELRLPGSVEGLDESFLAARERIGQHKLDECWAGEWHLVNPPRSWHNLLNTDLFVVLVRLAKERGLVSTCESMGLFAAEKDWRIPDQAHFRPEYVTDEGVTSAELVVEVRSPGDESYEKLPFYAARGVREVLIVHQDRRVELYRTDGTTLVPVDQPEGEVRSDVLGCTFSRVDGPRRRVAWDGGTADV